uniref:Beta-lactamase domain-containing protein n=1 Tax=Rhabditophanes sp. KR3021 TaxID=114890 RepID=A0AC35U4P9_9BILA
MLGRKRQGLKKNINIDGFVSPYFNAVKNSFTRNFEKQFERDGAAFSVYYKGEEVVNLWGGYADTTSERLWRKDTMNIAFSSSKAVAAICVALLVDRGQLKYEQLVCDFWPEFEENDKGKITVQMVMSHSCGLVLFDKQITVADAQNHEAMSQIIVDQRPHWLPGTEVGYHALTFGWLVDQIIRHVDVRKRGIGQFFREEIAEKHDIETYFGLPYELSHRVARIRLSNMKDRIAEFVANPKFISYYYYMKSIILHGYLPKMLRNPAWIQCLFKPILNNPDLYALEQCAVLGIGSARSFAKLFAKVLKGDIISRSLLETMSIPAVSNYEDVVTGARGERGYGFSFIPYSHNGQSFRLIGHAGVGGQNIRYDLENDLVICYMTNGMKGGLGDTHRTYASLVKSVYDIVLPSNTSYPKQIPVEGKSRRQG